MEKQLFDWTGGCDQNDTLAMQFYNCTLKVPILSYKIGDVCSVIEMNYESGIITIFKEEDSEPEVISMQLVISP